MTMRTKCELFDLLDELSEYHPDITPVSSDTKDNLLEKYFYWVDEYNDGYNSYNIPRPAWC